MANNRFYSDLAPLIPHLAKATKEVGDLRNDMYEALSAVAGALLAPGTFVALEADAPAAGEGTTTVRLRALDAPSGRPVDAPVVLEFAVFEDEDGVNWSSSGVLQTATAGSFLSGEGTPSAKVKTDANGVFECSLSEPVATTDYLSAFSTPTGPTINCVGSLAVVFAAA